MSRRQLAWDAAVRWLRANAPEVLIGVLVLLGLVIRVWGIRFGDPLVTHPDERQVAGQVIAMLKNGSLAPREPFICPTVFKYLLMPAFGLYYVWGLSVGFWTALAEVPRDAFGFYVVARGHSAVLGALTILLTSLLARRLWPGERGRWIGVVAALFVTFSFNHVRQSHFGVTDVPMTFFVMLAFVAAVAMYREGLPRQYAVAGGLVGLACATKYSALPMLAVLLAAHLLGRPWRAWLSPRLMVGLGAVPVGFFLGYPYALFNWRPFLEHLGKWGRRTGAVEFDPASRLDYLAAYSMESGLGFLFSLVLAAAIVYFVHRRRSEELLVVTLIVATLMILTHSSARFFPRYLLPMIPAAAILVGRLLVEMSDLVWRAPRLRSMPRWFAPAGIALVAIVLVWPQAAESVAFDRYRSLQDTRAAAHDYLVRRFPPGATVASEVQFLSLPREYRLLNWRPLHEERRRKFVRQEVDAVVFSSDVDLSVRDQPEAVRIRNRMRSRFVKLQEFSAQDGISSGPSIAVYLHPRTP